VVSRQIPDAPAFRCVGCGGTRLLPLTFASSRRTWRSELPVRSNAKCITCGCRYVGTHVLPAESTLMWQAACAMPISRHRGVLRLVSGASFSTEAIAV